MPKIVTPLTVTKIEKAQPKAKEYNLSDGDGLALRITPLGSKRWVFNYQHPLTKKRSNLGLGKYPEVSLQRARELRAQYRTLLAKGSDPKSEHSRSGTLTFEMVALEWLSIEKSKIKEETATAIRKSLEVNVFPYIGSYPINQITFTILKNEVLNNILHRESFEIARKVSRRLKHVMRFAVINEYTQTNPATDLIALIPSVQRRNAPTIDISELPELMARINFSTIRYRTRLLLEFQLHTMVRPGEAAEAEWNEISFSDAIWTIPAEKMKMKKSHEVPLSKQVISILEQAKKLSFDSVFVFPSERDVSKHTNKETVNKALKRLGCNPP